MTDPQEQKVQASIGTLNLPTYALIAENPNPVFHSQYGVAHIYPYTLQDEIASQASEVTYRTLLIENEYLRVTVLSDLGGRVYSVYDKISDREVFYKNPVIKFSPLAIRGAFFSGGVEFSFPVAHAPTTADPVNWELLENEDGSASIVIGGQEHIAGLRWSITLTLYPGRCALAQDVRLFNPTEFPGRYHYWTNASLDSTERTEFVYPLRRVRSYEFAGTSSWPVGRIDLITREPGLPGMEGVPMWPAERMHLPINFRWEKDMLAQVSIFGRDVKWDFFGTWQHGSNSGYAHFAKASDVAGMKLWSWGRAGVGIVNQTALTDDGSLYAETQCGAMETQLDFDFLPPGKMRAWREWWLPLRQIGGLTCANELLGARVHFQPADDLDQLMLTLGICPAEAFTKAELTLSTPSDTLVKQILSASPEQPWTYSQIIESGKLSNHPITLRIVARDGQPLFDYTLDRRPDNPAPSENAEEAPPETAQDYFLIGQQHENFDNRDAALQAYQDALKAPGEHAGAHLRLGLMRLRAADLGAAAQHFSLAAEAGTPEAHYYLGLTERYLGDVPAARAHLERVPDGSAIKSAALTARGSLAIAEADWIHAKDLFEESMREEAQNPRANIMLAIALQRAGRTSEAHEKLLEILHEDPLNPIALQELSKLDVPAQATFAEKLERFLADDPQYNLDLAAAYLDCGLHEDAQTILIRAWEGWPYAMVAFLLEYLCRGAGDEAGAERWGLKAQECPLDLVFPSRMWEALALQDHLKRYPDDVRAKYFLGNFFYANQRYEEAVDLWREASTSLSDCDVLLRNLGWHHWKRENEPQTAIELFERALKINAENQDLYIHLDTLYRITNQEEKRRQLVAAMRNLESQREDIRKRILLILVEIGEDREALQALTGENFVPLEMDQSFHDLYVQAYTQSAEEHLKEGRIEEAIQAFEAALEFPPNLGVGEPTTSRRAETLYRLGCAYELTGKFTHAIHAWRSAAQEHHRFGDELHSFIQMSLDKLSRYSELGFDV